MVNLIPIALKYKKEIAILAVIAVMAGSMVFMNMKIDNLQLKLENVQIELSMEKTDHGVCKNKVMSQNDKIMEMKLASDTAKAKANLAAKNAADIKAGLLLEIDYIKGEARVNSCDEGMIRLRESL